MADTKVYIGIPTAEYGRHAAFHDYVGQLEKPPGTIGRSFHTNTGARNRNLIIDDALAANATHILFIDDDMAFGPDALFRLLSHDRDIVSGLYFNRVYPFLPVLFDPLENGYKRHYLKDDEQGLIEVGAVGFGFLLVKVHIFFMIEQPWVRHGEIELDKRNEDLGFCKRAREAGLKVYCDLDTIIGHMGTATFWPANIDGKWHTSVDTGSNEVLTAPQATEGYLKQIKTPLDYTIK